ncbi:MAG: DUF4013 domain-containing protein [Deltaproteobacteria bacterium]|nr:DUF4013 domain-containing protein [Candidatus Zymogenaceae bacterium]
MRKLLSSIIYPVNGKQPTLRYLILCAVNLIPIVGTIVACGYISESMRISMNGKNETPPWDRILDLGIGGLKFLGVLAVYAVTFMVPFLIASFFIFVIRTPWSDYVGFFFLLITAILTLTWAFIIPMALFHMHRENGSFGSVLNYSLVLIRIRENMTSYIGLTLIFWFFCLVGAVLSLFFITLPYGFLLVIFPVMYLLLFASRLFGTMGIPDNSHIIGSDGVTGYE